MSTEADYYENPDFWVDAMFDAQRPRFEAVLDLIPEDARSLLDVGCGNGAFLRYISETGRAFERLHGTDRSVTALARLEADKTQASIDDLPFVPRSFDIATCLEVIEHLPIGIYEKGLENICRVADKYVLIGVPFEEDIEADLVRCPACTGKFNPDYHLRSYSEPVLNALLKPHGFEPAGKRLTGPMARYRFVTDWMARRRRARHSGNPFSTPIPCPMCSYMLPAAASVPAAASGTAEARSGGIKGAIKNLLRDGTSYGGIAMLYRRAG